MAHSRVPPKSKRKIPPKSKRKRENYIFDPGDTGPMDQPRWVKDRMYELGDIELRADYEPYMTSPLMRAAEKKLGPEELLGLIDRKKLPMLGVYKEGGLQNIIKQQSTVGRRLGKRLEEEGIGLHQFPHYRERLPRIMFAAKPPPEPAYIDEGAPTSRKEEKEDFETVSPTHNIPENLRKKGLSIIPHELLHYYSEEIKKKTGVDVSLHELIYYLEGLARKKLKGTQHQFETGPAHKWWEDRVMKIPFESEIKAEEKRVESGGIPNLLKLLDKYLQKETDIALGKIKVPKKRSRK